MCGAMPTCNAVIATVWVVGGGGHTVATILLCAKLVETMAFNKDGLVAASY